MSITPGTMVTANVRLLHRLGEGGMGSVWVAEHLGLDTEVAVKFIAAEYAKEPDAIARFRNEAAAAAKIRSPHVVQVFDHGVMADATPFIVMELLDGESLGQRLAKVGRLDPEEAAAVITQICKAFTEAHQRGIVHRDIKPDNVFLSRSAGELLVKVLDFGIAKQTTLPGYDQITSTAAIVGTPEYASPEQIVSAREVDFRADLWALSVVAYRALVGRSPFVAETMGGLIVEITNSRFTVPSAHAVGLPPAMDAWFARAFATRPEERFASARELAETFNSALMGVNIPSGEWPAPRTGLTPYHGLPLAAPGPQSGPPGAAAQPGTLGGAAANLSKRRARANRAVVLVGVGAFVALALGGGAAAVIMSENGESAPATSTADEPSAAVAEPPQPEEAASTEVSLAESEPASSATATAASQDAGSPSPPPRAARPASPPPPATATASAKQQPSESERKERLGF